MVKGRSRVLTAEQQRQQRRLRGTNASVHRGEGVGDEYSRTKGVGDEYSRTKGVGDEYSRTNASGGPHLEVPVHDALRVKVVQRTWHRRSSASDGAGPTAGLYSPGADVGESWRGEAAAQTPAGRRTEQLAHDHDRILLAVMPLLHDLRVIGRTQAPRGGGGAPSSGADVGGVSPVPVQARQQPAQPKRRCGDGAPK